VRDYKSEYIGGKVNENQQ